MPLPRPSGRRHPSLGSSSWCILGGQHRLLIQPPHRKSATFSEGTRCQEAGALRAAAAMYRAAVEELCKDRGATGRNLKDKIADLSSRGVPADVVRDLDEARTLGNWSLHDGLAFSYEEVDDVASLIQEAVFVVYVQPEQRAAFRATRQQRRDQARTGA
ncbi:DUF4145 domain-containing protein [Streptomyces sp. NPDC088747]|uniref:DUF4145 domain-containing protein n=1 Tax=Streptomyces sp. NPDC088747 TaxID=3365886 RepID=UPI00382E2DD2